MKFLYSFIILIFISSDVAADDIEKVDFIAESGAGLTDALCTFDRFLQCVGDSEKLCRSQMNWVVVPHCLKKYDGTIPEKMSENQAQKIGGRLKECVVITYAAFNQVDHENFSACMTK